MRYTTQHAFDGENEHTLVIYFIYRQGAPERGRTYDCAGEPAEDPQVEVISILVDGLPATLKQGCQVDECERLYDELLLYGADCLADERAAAAEYRAEMMKE
jgi:hypothetical protein